MEMEFVQHWWWV